MLDHVSIKQVFERHTGRSGYAGESVCEYGCTKFQKEEVRTEITIASTSGVSEILQGGSVHHSS